jgi:hypothetical protein
MKKRVAKKAGIGSAFDDFLQSVSDINAPYQCARGGLGFILGPTYSADEGPQAIAKECEGAVAPLHRRRRGRPPEGGRSELRREGRGLQRGGRGRAIQWLGRHREAAEDRADGDRILDRAEQAEASAATRAGQHVEVEGPAHEIRPRPVPRLRW